MNQSMGEKKGKTAEQERKRRIKAEEGRKREIGKKEQRLNMTNIAKGSTCKQPAPIPEHAPTLDTGLWIVLHGKAVMPTDLYMW